MAAGRTPAEDPGKETRQSRSDATRTALMHAAEKLIAQRGIENVSIRDIVGSAGQKNESALQYHFGNRQGLIKALHGMRQAQVQARRETLLDDLATQHESPPLRDICKLMVAPAFELACERPEFRRYIKAFGHEITLADETPARLMNRRGGASTKATGLLLQAALNHLEPAAFQRRVDGALRFVSASMVHHARQKNAFRGPDAQVFFHSLIDALVGLLSAPESDETRAATLTLDE